MLKLDTIMLFNNISKIEKKCIHILNLLHKYFGSRMWVGLGNVYPELFPVYVQLYVISQVSAKGESRSKKILMS